MSPPPIKPKTQQPSASHAVRNRGASGHAECSGETLGTPATAASGGDAFERRTKSRRRGGPGKSRQTPSPSPSPPPPISRNPLTEIAFFRNGHMTATHRMDAVDSTTLERLGDLARDSQDRPCLLATMPASLPHLPPHVVSVPRDNAGNLASFLPHMEKSWLTRAANIHENVHFYMLVGQPEKTPVSAFFVGSLGDAYAALRLDIDGDRERGQWVRICYEASRGVPEYLLIVAQVLKTNRYRGHTAASHQAFVRIMHTVTKAVAKSDASMRQVWHRAVVHAVDAHLEDAAFRLLNALETEGGITDDMRAEHLAVAISSCNTSMFKKLMAHAAYDVNMAYRGRPLLHYAAAQSTTMTRVLLSHHANALAKDAEGQQAHLYTNDVERRRLLSRAALGSKSSDPTTP